MKKVPREREVKQEAQEYECGLENIENFKTEFITKKLLKNTYKRKNLNDQNYQDS